MKVKSHYVLYFEESDKVIRPSVTDTISTSFILFLEIYRLHGVISLDNFSTYWQYIIHKFIRNLVYYVLCMKCSRHVMHIATSLETTI